MKKIAIFASGSGSNAENIISFFKTEKTAVVTKVFCNNPKAAVFERCKRLQVDAVLFSREDFFKSDTILNQLKGVADYIVLAGFLLKIPTILLKLFQIK